MLQYTYVCVKWIIYNFDLLHRLFESVYEVKQINSLSSREKICHYSMQSQGPLSQSCSCRRTDSAAMQHPVHCSCSKNMGKVGKATKRENVLKRSECKNKGGKKATFGVTFVLQVAFLTVCRPGAPPRLCSFVSSTLIPILTVFDSLYRCQGATIPGRH